jgi:hypothetical protein
LLAFFVQEMYRYCYGWKGEEKGGKLLTT